MTNTNDTDFATDKAKQREQAREFAIAAARSLADNQCTETVVLDLKGQSPVAEMLVIATGTIVLAITHPGFRNACGIASALELPFKA